LYCGPIQNLSKELWACYDLSEAGRRLIAPVLRAQHLKLVKTAGAALGRSGDLPPAQLDQARLPQAQAAPPGTNPLRQARTQLPDRCAPRLNPLWVRAYVSTP
jgi:hypothetical protein